MNFMDVRLFVLPIGELCPYQYKEDEHYKQIVCSFHAVLLLQVACAKWCKYITLIISKWKKGKKNFLVHLVFRLLSHGGHN